MMHRPPISGAERGHMYEPGPLIDFETKDAWDMLFYEADAIQPYFTSYKEPSRTDGIMTFDEPAWHCVSDAGELLENWDPNDSSTTFLIDTGTKQEPFKISMASSQLAKFALRNKIAPELVPLVLPDRRTSRDTTAGDVYGRHGEFAFSFYCCLGIEYDDVRRVTIYHSSRESLWLIFGDCESIREVLLTQIKGSEKTYRMMVGGKEDTEKEDAQQFHLVSNMLVCGWRRRLSVLESQLRQTEHSAHTGDELLPYDREPILQESMRISKEILDLKMQMQTCLQVQMQISHLGFFPASQEGNNAFLSERRNDMFLLERRIARAEYLVEEADRIIRRTMSELTQTHRSQVERIGWNNLKVSYVLQALLRSPTIVVVVLLPGLYVSSVLTVDSIKLWLAIALPLTAFVIVLTALLYRTNPVSFLKQIVKYYSDRAVKARERKKFEMY